MSYLCKTTGDVLAWLKMRRWGRAAPKLSYQLDMSGRGNVGGREQGKRNYNFGILPIEISYQIYSNMFSSSAGDFRLTFSITKPRAPLHPNS